MEKLSGIELIARERKEQIEKHGFTMRYDAQTYGVEVAGRYAEPSDLVVAAIASVYGDKTLFPPLWNGSPFIDKICAKEYKDRVVIAGALLAAEIDTLPDFE